MTKERFSEILREYGFTDRQIEMLWATRRTDTIDEQRLREAAKYVAPVKDSLVQA